MISKYFSGNVYVIDDQINEAQPIIDALYKNHVPHIYSDGKRSSLPSEPQHVRLIFLDLNLFPALNPRDKNSFKGSHAAILTNLLSNKSGSYIILIWSKQEDTYFDDYMEIFDNDDYGLKNRIPLEIIRLDKQNYFHQSTNESGDVKYEWIPEKQEELLTLIEQKLKGFNAFEVLFTWETLIRRSGSKVVDSLFEIGNGLSEAQRINKINEILSKLSISVLGEKNFKKASNQEKTDGFMLALSELLDDEIDKEIILNEQKPEFTNWMKVSHVSPDYAKINSKLLLSFEKRKNELTGSLFNFKEGKHDFKDLFLDSIDVSKEGLIHREISAANEGVDKKDKENYVKFEDYFNSAYFAGILLKQIIPIELNLTPLCDVVQKKEKYYRLVPGFILSETLLDYSWKSSDRLYKSPIINLPILGNSFILLDFRFMHSCKSEEVQKYEKIMTLRKGFVDDIQLRLSNHISRLGVLNL